MRIKLLPALIAGMFATTAFALDPFVVKDIRVEGIQRTDAGTIFSYLPVKVGETIDEEKAAAAIKALYATGFFRDVRLEAQNGVLIVTVLERPTISAIEVTGAKEFDKDTLKKALKDVGLAESRIFDRSALDRAEQEIKRQYISRGRYAAEVTTIVTPQERNRASINFVVTEGEVAKIAQSQHRGQHGVFREGTAGRDGADHAGLADLVHQERPVFQAKAGGRSGNAAQLLHQPRVSGFQRRFHAGVDHARTRKRSTSPST